MVVRLTHGKRPDITDYTFQALGSSFSLTGVAAGVRKASRLAVPDKIPYLLQGRSANISKLPPVWSVAPSYSITEGTVYSNQAVSVSVPGGGSPTITLAWVSGVISGSTVTTKPAWVTFTAGTAPTISFSGHVDANDVTSLVLSATANGQTVNSSAGSITVTGTSGVGALSTTFTLVGTSSQTAAPFTFAHAFKDGDVSASQVALASGAADWQCRVLTYWPSGYAKHAIISGRANVINGNTALTLTAGSDPGGTALTEANLASALPTTTIAAGAFTWTLNSSISTADRHRTVCTGPVMSNFIYRKAVSGSNHLVLWADVRVYKGGNVEIFPWVENAYLTVASPTNDVRTYTVTIGGSSRFSQSIDVKHRTRIPLVTGSTFSYWTGTDPGITPKHDRTYLMATKLVPNYGWTSPSEATLNGVQQTYSPNTLAGISSSMGVAGSSAALINSQQALYITSNADSRAYRAAVTFGLSGGSWSTHYRDENTNEPIKFSGYPNASINIQNTPVIPSGSGGENGSPVTTHQPSYGYLPFLITGRWWFWEESAFWTTWNYLKATVAQRTGTSSYPTGAAGIIDSANGTYATRGAHWSIRTLAQTLTLCPTSHSLHADLKTAWEANTDFYKQKYIDGTHASGWVSPQGILGTYNAVGGSSYPPPLPSNSIWGSAWMNNFGIQAWGFASDIGLPQSATSLANHLAVRNKSYLHIVGRAGDGLNGNFNWRRFAVYGYPYGSDDIGLPPDTWHTIQQSAAIYISETGLDANLSPAAGLSLKNHTSDTDVTSGSSTAQDYLPMGLAALAYAVDHGATGAVAGWNRLAGASNYTSALAGLHNNPEHGVVPYVPTSMPSWYPASAGQVVQISSSTTIGTSVRAAGGNSYPGTNPDDIVIPWSGGALVYVGGLPYLLAYGGGHGDSSYNGIHKFGPLTSNTPEWSVFLAPSAVADVNLSGTPGPYLDGRQASTHSYNSLVGVGDTMYATGTPGSWPSNSYATSYAFTPAGQTVLANIITTANYHCAAYYNGKIYAIGGNSTFDRLRIYDIATNVWSSEASATIAFGNYVRMAVDTNRGALLLNGGSLSNAGAGAYWPSLATLANRRTFISAATGGATGSSSIEFDADRDVFVSYVSASATLYECSAATLAAGGDAVWAARTFSGTPPAASPSQGTFGRFRYVPELKGYIVAPNLETSVYFFRST